MIAASPKVTSSVVGIGDIVIDRYPGYTFTTVLGSCIAVGLWDPVTKIGGLNHFLLAHAQGDTQNDFRYGDVSIPALLARLRDAGARRESMKAIIVGGANVIRAMLPIGTENAAFAKSSLAEQRIPIVESATGGAYPRRLSFTPNQGTYRISVIKDDSTIVD